MMSPGAAAGTSRIGEHELLLRAEPNREVVADATRREASETAAAGLVGLAGMVETKDGSGEAAIGLALFA